ncbi:MAG: hypothetical protein EOM67_06590 [Spirochaetia bacterium]|nr:hypothetical protein [Spirochaetia bacterium]
MIIACPQHYLTNCYKEYENPLLNPYDSLERERKQHLRINIKSVLLETTSIFSLYPKRKVETLEGTMCKHKSFFLSA